MLSARAPQLSAAMRLDQAGSACWERAEMHAKYGNYIKNATCCGVAELSCSVQWSPQVPELRAVCTVRCESFDLTGNFCSNWQSKPTLHLFFWSVQPN
jgi:hypothetical protein